MKLQGLIATTQSLFVGHRSMFVFVVLPFVGVVFHGVRSGNTFGGGDVFRGNASSPASYAIPLFLFFSFFLSSLFSFLRFLP